MRSRSTSPFPDVFSLEHGDETQGIAHLSDDPLCRRLARRTPSGRPGAAGKAQHPGHHGRRHRAVEHQRLQSRHDGLPHAQHRPHRPRRRDLHRLLRPAIVHGGARRLHHRPVADPHRPPESRPAGRTGRAVGEGPDHRRHPEAAGLRHRPVRQEPPRRPQRLPADGARLRRVLRQPLSPQCRGGAGEHRLSEGSDLQGAVRPARRAEMRRSAHRHARRRSTLRQVGQAEVRGHRPAHPEAHGDGGRGVSRRHARLHRPRQPRQEAVLRVDQLQPHAHLDPSQEGVRGQDRLRRLRRRHGRA